MTDLLFPHDEVREVQKDLMETIFTCLEEGKSVIAHAPTGLGKTAASLAPAMTYALKHQKVVFFLTSRHTQHLIALETLKKMKEKYEKSFVVTDIIGKKHMCLQPGVLGLYTNEFFEYCRNLRENSRCEYYLKTLSKQNLTPEAKQAVNALLDNGMCSTDTVIEKARLFSLCPYEVAQYIAKQAAVIIADYYYIFNPSIRESFLRKINRDLKDCIIIADEAHNLPSRLRELMTFRLSTGMLERAAAEARKFNYTEAAPWLIHLRKSLELVRAPEKLVTKAFLTELVSSLGTYDDIVGDLAFYGDEVRKVQQRSSLASVSEFLDAWKGEDKGFMRYLRSEGENTTLIYRCLDPSLASSDVSDGAHSVILMSGTLTPTSMYRDLLALDEAEELEFKSPFPEKNRLNIIIPETSTKFTARSEEQFKRIAIIAAGAANSIEGNCAIFFPSYNLLALVAKYFNTIYEKTIFTERRDLSPEERRSLIEKFKKYEKVGSCLLAVASGSYGEGIDLPGDFLKGVIIVGLPLQKPDLETEELIKYYDAKFGKGWDYGYLFPAFNKTLQNAGRCIRSKHDKGIIVFLDERYTWQNYYRCFPRGMKILVTKNYREEIKNFFASA